MVNLTAAGVWRSKTKKKKTVGQGREIWGRGVWWGARGGDELDGEDERCVVEGDSIRGVKANRGCRRCAACSPDY